MTKGFINILSLSILFIACDHNANDTQKLQAEVIAVHDSVMPMMGTFVRDNIQVKSLLTKMDSLKKAMPALDTLKEREDLNNLQISLSEANDAMTDWMHNFEPAPENKSTDEIKDYFQNELEKVKALQNKFTEAEKTSKLVLEKYNK